jgi:hypothetical protein
MSDRSGGATATADLHRIADLATRAGLPSLAAEAERTAERIAEGRFYVACVGQFKRGKSTLLNALIGEPILPTGVVPVTSVVTVVRYGAERGARIRLATGEWQPIPLGSLAAYVSEDENPENEKGIAAVEAFVPAKLLESGMCLVDTPGVGSVFSSGTEATRAFVPHIDAALVVLGADPPISGDEVALLEAVAERVQTLIFVLSKADRLSESDRMEAARFAQRVIEQRLRRTVGPILQVSALERLSDVEHARDWDTLVDLLGGLARDAGAGLVRAAERRAVRDLTARVGRGVDEQLRALRSPVEETERRLQELRRATAELERSLGDLSYLLAGEQDRVVRAVMEDRTRFLARALPEAGRELFEAVSFLRRGPGSEIRERVLDTARDVARRHLDGWLQEQQPVTEARYREAAQRFLDLANEFLACFATARDLGLDQLPPSLGSETGLRVRGELFYTEMLRLTAPSALAWLLDRLRPRGRTFRAVLAQASEYLEELLSTNSARIQNDLIERVRKSRERLETEIRSRLTDARDSAAQALERARAQHAIGQQAVQAEIARLTAIRAGTGALASAQAPGPLC